MARAEEWERPQAQSPTQPLTLQGQTGTAKGLAQGCWEGTGAYLESNRD